MEIIPENDENFVSGNADDHALINTFHPEDTDISSKLVSNISYIKDWMNKNQLKMNDAKTEFTVFGSKHQVQRNDLKSLNIDDTTIRAKFVIKFLGAYLDESLNMKTHIANRTKNALYNLHLMKKHQEIYYPRNSKNASVFTGSITIGLLKLGPHRFTKSYPETLQLHSKICCQASM